MLHCWITFLLLFLSCESFCQKLLFHKNNFKEQTYETGDVISFRLGKDKSKITRQILGFEDSLIVFQDYKINPKEISAIYVDKRTRTWFAIRYKYKYLLPAIGGGYLLLQLVNTGEADKGTWIFSGSMIAAGALAKISIPDWIKIKGRRRLMIVNKSPANRRH